jgi:hypothetical protein
MNTKLLLIALAAVSLSSCSSVYKSGQTPDDVYYSPVRLYGTEENNDNKRDDTRRDNGRYYAEQSQIRFGISNPLWRYLDDFSYNPYQYGYNYGYYYNPYYCPVPVYDNSPVKVTNPKNSTPRMTNLAAYNNAYSNTNVKVSPKYSNAVNTPVRNYNNNNSKLSNTLNKIFNSGSNYNNSNNNNSNSQNNSSQSSRSYTPSSNSSSTNSSSSNSSSGSTTSRPVRNGKG